MNEASKASRKSSNNYLDNQRGACVLSTSGKIFLGCDVLVEGPCEFTLCAEANALAAMVLAEGQGAVATHIAVISPDGRICGRCLDMVECFGTHGTQVICGDTEEFQLITELKFRSRDV